MNTPVFVHPYQGAYDFDWPDDYNGNLTLEEVKQRKKEWVFWVDTRHPLTKDIHTEIVADQDKQPRRPTFWGKAGGLELTSGGKSIKAFTKLERKWSGLAAERAKAKRKEAGWRGWNYLTSPTGVTTGPNGQRFGPYALPTDEFDKGMWDGILTANMSFTV